MMFAPALILKAEFLIKKLSLLHFKFSCAESCTGGLLSALLTEVSGASKVFDRGFIVYSNQAKIEMLGVDEMTLDKFGAVSEEVAAEMVRAVIGESGSDVGISITGIAGPRSDLTKKAVGLVYIGMYFDGLVRVQTFNFSGDRAAVRKASLIAVLEMLEGVLLDYEKIKNDKGNVD